MTLSNRAPYLDLLRVGQGVYCSVINKHGAIYKIVGEQSFEASAVNRGAEIKIVWKDGYTTKVNETHIRQSVQWQIVPGVFYHPKQISVMLTDGQIKKAQKISNAKAQDNSEKEKLEEIKNDKRYSNLTQATESLYGPKLAAKNIRKQLKDNFPKTKFSVRSDSNSVRVIWTDGPTCEQVEFYSKAYKDEVFNGIDDSSTNIGGPWHDVFGYARFVTSSRDVSDDLIRKAVKDLKEKYKSDLCEDTSFYVEQFKKGELINYDYSWCGHTFQTSLNIAISKTSLS